MRQREIALWLDERWCHALEKYLPGGSVSEKLEKQLDMLIKQLPEEVHKKISQEILQEDQQARQEQEAARRFALFRVTENGSTDLFLIENHGNILYVAQQLRAYLRRQSAASTRFASMFHRVEPITAQQFESHITEWKDNSGRVTGIFEIDFDKGLFSEWCVMGTAKVYSVKDVSVAAYHASKKQGLGFDRMQTRFIERLADRELDVASCAQYLTGSRRLRPEEVSFDGEVMECSGKLNFYVPVYFDPDAVFGTNVANSNNDDYINVCANYDLSTGCVCPELEITLYRADGSQSEYRYKLTKPDCKALLPKMEAYSRQQSGMSLADWVKEYAAESKEEVISQ